LIANKATLATPSINKYGNKTNSVISSFFAPGDVTFELDYKKKKIGITTFGDDSKSISGKINMFTNDNCECIVCACHPTGTSKTCVDDYVKASGATLITVYKVGCKTDYKIDSKFANLCDFSDDIAANEIISHI